MLKYRGSKLIRAGIIGVVLAILVIAIGLQPERLVQWATALRYQALFSEAGGLDRGQRRDRVRHQGRLGVVRSNSKTVTRWSVSPSTGKYALGSDTTAHIRTGTLLGERVLALESAGSGTLEPQHGHPDLADLLALLVDRRGQRPHHQYRGHQHRHAQPVVGHAGRRRSTRSLRSWGRRSTACRGCRGRSTTATKAWPNC